MKRVWLWVIVLSLVVFLPLVWLAGSRLAQRQPVRLAGVGYGPTQTDLRDAWWENLLWLRLPQSSGRRVSLTIPGLPPVPPNVLVFWTRHEHVHSGRPPEQWYATVSDEHGCEAPASSRASVNSPDEALQMWEVPVFPRRSEFLTLRLYRQTPDGRGVPGPNFRIVNPAPGPYPNWTPQPLPVARQAGDLRFILTALEPGSAPKGVHLYGRETYSRATFQVERNGSPLSSWEPVRFTVSDATGNRWSPWYDAPPFYQRAATESSVYVPRTLWPDEPAWKLRVEFARNALNRFAPEELWTVRNLPVPQRGRRARPNATATRQGMQLSLSSFAGPSAQLTGWRGQQLPWLYGVLVEGTKPTPDLHVTLVRVTDDRGRIVQGPALRHYQPPLNQSNDKQQGFGFRLPTGAKAVDLTFAIHRSRTVEFLAKPGYRQSVQASSMKP